MGKKNKLSALDKQNKRLKKWLMSLTKEQKEFLLEYCTERERADIEAQCLVYDRVLRTSIYDMYKDVLVAEEEFGKLIDKVVTEAIHLRKFKNGSVEYMSKLKESKKGIIREYEKLVAAGKKEKEIMQELKNKFPLLTVNSIKNTIIEYKRDQTKKKIEEGNVDAAVGYIFNEPKPSYVEPNNLIISEKEEPVKTKKEMVFKFLSAEALDHIGPDGKLNRQELLFEVSKRFNIAKQTANIYYSEWKKNIYGEEVDIVENKQEEPTTIKVKGPYEIISKNVIVDIKGKYGSYHVENNSISTLNTTENPMTERYIKEAVEAKKEELAKQLLDFTNKADEMIEILEMCK